MGSWDFIAANRRFLSFGILMSLFSSFGQTYYIAMFSAEIRGVFDLSHGDFGEIYAYATLASGTTLIWLGRKIDHIDLRFYSVLVCVGLIAACLMMSQVSSVVMLGLAIFTLRLFGQGLMSHTAVTSMARYFHERRGLAIGLASTGHAIGEAMFPYMAVILIAVIILLILFLTGVFAADVEGDIEAPAVDVSASGGELPDVDVDAADVRLGSETEEVEVPTIDVEPAEPDEE